MHKQKFSAADGLDQLNVLVDRTVRIRVIEDQADDVVVSYPEPYEPLITHDGKFLAIHSPHMAAPKTAVLEVLLSARVVSAIKVTIINNGGSVRISGLEGAPVRIGNFRAKNAAVNAHHVAFTGGVLALDVDQHDSSGAETNLPHSSFSNVVLENDQAISKLGSAPEPLFNGVSGEFAISINGQGLTDRGLGR